MSITITELKQNLSMYIELSEKEDIYITQYGKVVSKLTNPHRSRIDIAQSLIGSMPDSLSLEEAKTKRIEDVT